MVKEGPCCHCGITSTPLWRNGPPNKPVLCNACGMRWRTYRLLDGYIPKHGMSHDTQSSETEISEDSTEDLSYTNQDDSDGPNAPDLENVPRQRRSPLTQRVVSTVELLRRQLYDTACKEPKIFMKEEVLIYNGDDPMSTPYETALGAMLLNPEPKDGNQGTSSST